MAQGIQRAPTGPQKAAIFLLSLSPEHSSKIMSKLEEYEIRELSLVMATLGKVDSEMVENLFIEFAEKLHEGTGLVGSYESTERALLQVMGKEKVDAIMEEIRGPAGRTMWDKLGNVNEDILASYLKGEYPQTVAVVLSKIKTAHAARVLVLLPDEFALEVMQRMLRMESVQKEVLNDVENTLKTEFMNNISRGNTQDTFEVLAEIFNSFDRQTEEKFMTKLEERDSEAAERVKSLMFTFDDLIKLDAAGIQTIIKTVDKGQLGLALKGAKDSIKDLFFANMSERAAKLLKEDMEALGMVKLKAVDEAQQGIVISTKELADRGEIKIPEASEEEEMVA